MLAITAKTAICACEEVVFAGNSANLSRPDLYPSSCSLRGNWIIPILPTKLRPFEDQERSVSEVISLTMKRTSFHEWYRARREGEFSNH